MSENLEQAVRAAHRTWNEGGPAALAASFWHPQIKWHEPSEVPGARVYSGREEVLRYFSQFDDAPGNLRIDQEDIIAAGDGFAVAVLHLVGTARSSGVPMDLAVTHLYKLDNDFKAVEVRAYLDPEQALADLGLAE